MAATVPGPLPLDFSEAVALAAERLAEGLEQIPGGPGGWRPTRLLFRSFWLFEREEFRFVHGRLFLRGANASGKSTVLAAAVPLVLDGDRSRHRLDPFGGAGRSLQYFLLGPDTADRDDPDAFYHEQRTGYVALEFARPGPPAEYRTVGIGLHCSRHRDGMPVSFWGFCLRDGRRLGRGFDLVGPEGTALRRQELEQAIGPGGTVVATVADYRALVNEELFGFADPGDYAHVLNLLLELRAPKLNRDMGPRVVGELLGESLRPVDPALFGQLRTILERIDDYVDGCADLRRRTEAAERLDEAVSLVQLRRSEIAAAQYLEALADLRRTRAAAEEAATAAQAAEAESAAAQGRAAGTASALAEVEGRLAALREGQALQAAHALSAAQERRTRAAARLQAQEAEVARRDSRGAAAQQRASAARALWEARGAALRGDLDGFVQAAEAAEWPLGQDAALQVRAALSPALAGPVAREPDLPGGADWVLPAARSREEQLLLVRRRLQQRDAAAGAEAAVQASFQAHHAHTQQAREEQARLEGGLAAAAEQAAEALRLWGEGLRALRLPREDLAEACRVLASHRDPAADLGQALQPLRQMALEQRRHGERARRDRERERDAAAEAVASKAAELAVWEARSEAVPPRSAATEAARAALRAAAVPARPFYEAEDLEAGLDPAAAARIEAAALQAGLLDALVVAPQDLSAARACLDAAGLGDVFVLDAQAARAALGAETGGAGAALLPDGSWRHGLLGGRAPAAAAGGAPVYFGVENRRRRHREQLETLRAELREREGAQGLAAAALAQAQGALMRAEAELEELLGLPALPALQAAAQRATDAAAHAEAARRAEEAALAELERARAAVAAATLELEEACRPLPETRGRTAQGVDELIARLRALVTAGRGAAAGARALADAAAAVLTAEEVAGREREDLERAVALLTTQRDELAAEDAAVQTLRAVLDSPEGREQRARHEALLGEERRLRRQQGEAREAVALWRERAGSRAAEAGRAQAAAEAAAVPEAEGAQALGAQLAAYPTLASFLETLRQGPGGAEEVARSLLARRREDVRLRERLQADLDAAKTVLLRAEIECRDTLADYAPELDDAAGLLRFRAAGTAVWPAQLREELRGQLERQEQLLQASERQLYEEFLLHQMREALHRHIRDTEDWAEHINADLRQARLGSGEVLELRWVPLPGAGIAAHLNLLRTDPAMLAPEDRQTLAEAFRAEVERVRQDQRESTGDLGFAEALEEAMDYRHWFRFEIVSRAPHQRAALLDDRRFSTRSGAEKSLALMLPLAAAAAARYRLAREDAPRLIAFDEAFAGVDPRNVEETLRFLCRFGFSWVMASERIWGVGAVLPAAATCEIIRRGNVVAVLPFFWNGERLLPAGPEGEGA